MNANMATPKSPPIRPNEATDAQSIPTLLPTESINITIPLSPKSMPIEHNVPAPPPTPPAVPVTISPQPLRYPDTLGTLIEIRNSGNKGLGVFATSDILPGTVLLSEAPVVALRDNGARTDPLDGMVNGLSPERRKSFFSLHSYSRNKNDSRSRSIVYSNGYSIDNDLATGVFETASRINHSCVPNSHYLWEKGIGRMVFWNRFKLLEGEEITVNYGHKKAYLKKIYGFDCTCGGCTEPESDAVSSSGSESGREKEQVGIDQVLQESGDVGKENI